MKVLFIFLFFVPFFGKAQTWTTKTLSDSVRAISKRTMEQGKTVKVLQDSIKILNKKIDSLQVSLNPNDFDIKNKVVSLKKKQ